MLIKRLTIAVIWADEAIWMNHDYGGNVSMVERSNEFVLVIVDIFDFGTKSFLDTQRFVIHCAPPELS